MDTAPGDDDYRHLADFRYAIRTFLRFSEEAARTAGIDTQQHQLLLTVRAYGGHDGLAIRDIAERLQLRHHSVVELVDRAASAGLASRHQALDDRRKVLVQLTASGVEVLERLSLAHLAELRSQAPHLVGVLRRIVGEAGAVGSASRG